MIQFDDNGGSFTAKIASLAPIVDYDFDVTLPGAFKNGQVAFVSPWGHSSIIDNAQPVGLAKIRTDGQSAFADGVWFTTSTGQQTRELVKQAGTTLEYSYGFKILAASTDYKELRQFGPTAQRILKSLDVYEVSPVLKGAGIGTGTVSAKHGKREFGDYEMAQLAKQTRQTLARASELLRPVDPEQEELQQIWLRNLARQCGL